MQKYQKKPVAIDAVQWDGTAAAATPIIDRALTDGHTITFECPLGEGCSDTNHVLSIRTLEGTMVARRGDYVIRGTHGEYYPCKPDIFEENYEGVTDDSR